MPCQPITKIGHSAPTLTDVATGRKRKIPYSKVTTRKKRKSPGQSLAAAAALQTDVSVDLSSSSSEDTPEHQSGGKEDSQHTPPPPSPIIQVQHSPPTPKKSRADSPLTQLADHALSGSLGQPNIAIPSSSSQPLVPISSNLGEIRLKQAQESPDNSLFSFQIGAASQEEGEKETSADSIVLSNEVKAKIQESLQFLNQDIGQLIKNAQPIRAILGELEGILPEAIEDALTHAAFIVSHRAQFNKAQKQLADRCQ
ncbi:unnamed protein product [Urochloa humidicola]